MCIRDSPVTSNVTGCCISALHISRPLNANPSIADLGNGGCVTAAYTGFARICPRQSADRFSSFFLTGIQVLNNSCACSSVTLDGRTLCLLSKWADRIMAFPASQAESSMSHPDNRFPVNPDSCRYSRKDQVKYRRLCIHHTPRKSDNRCPVLKISKTQHCPRKCRCSIGCLLYTSCASRRSAGTIFLHPVSLAASTFFGWSNISFVSP